MRFARAKTKQPEQPKPALRHKPAREPQHYTLHITPAISAAGWNDHTYLGHAVRFIAKLDLTDAFTAYMNKLAQDEASDTD